MWAQAPLVGQELTIWDICIIIFGRGNGPMSRRLTVDAVMRKAYRKRDVETFVWGLLKNFEEEIKTGTAPKARTFTGRDIVGLVNTLVNLERVRKETKSESTEEVVPNSAWGDWGEPPSDEDAEQDDAH